MLTSVRSCISLNWLVCYYGCSRIGLLAVELWRKLELRCRVETQRILGLDLHTCSLNRTCRIKCESCGSSELIPGSAVYKAQVIFAWLLCFGYNVSTFLSLITVVTLLILWSYVMMLLRLMGPKAWHCKLANVFIFLFRFFSPPLNLFFFSFKFYTLCWAPVQVWRIYIKGKEMEKEASCGSSNRIYRLCLTFSSCCCVFLTRFCTFSFSFLK